MTEKHYLEEDNEDMVFLEENIPKAFGDLDRTFRCSICASLFDKAVTIKECGHTFCSVCVRNYWVAIRNGVHRQEKSCPICRTTVNVMDVEKALVMNRSVQEGVKAFKQLLLNHCRSSDKTIDNGTSGDQIEGCKRQRRSSRRKFPPTRRQNKLCERDGNDLCGNDSKKIDAELPIKKKMESRNYARMKKKDLQSLCREFTIPTTGTEQDLMNRLRNYQNMWNAEVMHSIEPKKPSDIAAKLSKEEQAQEEEKRRAKLNGSANVCECIRKLNANINSGDENSTSGNARFDMEFKGNFKNLTDQLQLRMNKKLPSPHIVAGTLSNVGKSVNEASKDQLPRGIGERESIPVPDASCIEYIDVEPCPAVSDRYIRNLTTDLNPSSSPQSTGSPERKKRSFETMSSHIQNSTSSTKPKTTIPGGQHSVANRSFEKKKTRSLLSSSLTTNSVGWACGRCTYVNKGIDYICRICGNRKNLSKIDTIA